MLKISWSRCGPARRMIGRWLCSPRPSRCQLGKLLNLTVYGVDAKLKHDLVQKYGGIPIDYKEEDFTKRIQELTNNGVDAVFDPIGGKNFKKSFKSLKPGGHLVAFGFYNAVKGKGGNLLVDFMKVLLCHQIV